MDVAAARAALAESDERIPYAEVRRNLGLTDEQEAKRSGAKARARRYEIQFTRAADRGLAALPRVVLRHVAAAILALVSERRAR